MQNLILTATTAIGLSLSGFSLAQTAETGTSWTTAFTTALTDGKVSLDARYRLETVDQDDLGLKNATASTLRTRLGYLTGNFKGFEALVEMEDVSPIGTENYNSTTNGMTDRSTVVDPDDTEINQYFLRFKGMPKTALTAGRQWFVLDNHRFVGDSIWRQNQQTFDGYTGVTTFIPRTTLTYAYLFNANRPFGEDSPIGDYDMHSHIVHVAFKVLPALTITPQVYLLDFNKDQFRPISNKTFALRASGEWPLGDFKFLYTGEFADQSDYEDGNPAIDNTYWFAEPAIQYEGFSAKFGYEVLGGNGTVGFLTPLYTAHRHQGFSEVVETGLVPNGIIDRYLALGFDFLGAKLLARYHDFDTERGEGDLGSEVDLMASYTFLKHYTAGVKYAAYDADEFAVDTDKLWLWLEAKFN
jgi:hypothetical protein